MTNITKKIAVSVLLASACVYAAEPPAVAEQPQAITHSQAARDGRLWRLSLAGLAAANAMDIGSSWGKHELNGVLQSPNGTFGPRGAAVKLSFQGALLGSELLMLRHDRRGSRRRLAAWINLAASAAIAGVAIRNSRIPRQ